MESILTSLNVLQHPSVSRKVDHEQLHPESPLAIKVNLKLGQLDDVLFPSLVTGVRWWPFLCLAVRFKSETDYRKIFAASRRLRRDLGTRARIGPLTKSSFGPYLSMARNLKSDSDCAGLNSYLSNLDFHGDAKFFHQYRRTDSWRKWLLKANGSQGKGYIRAQKQVSKQSPESNVLDVVTLILENPPEKYDKSLWLGCFSFVFLRCLFGGFDQQGGEPVSYSEYVLRWRDLLTNILLTRSSYIPDTAYNPAYVEYLRKIEDKNSPPPLAEQAKLFRAQDRPILAALRIPLFHNLYFKPMPARISR